eukprot:44626-Pelagomonas_calceolata.AAC.2
MRASMPLIGTIRAWQCCSGSEQTALTITCPSRSPGAAMQVPPSISTRSSSNSQHPTPTHSHGQTPSHSSLNKEAVGRAVAAGGTPRAPDMKEDGSKWKERRAAAGTEVGA